jgi:uncharacterized protein YyaL (SSP411 family)
MAAAVQCAELLVDLHWDPESGHLARTSLDGTVSTEAPGVLEDYADLAEGLLALYQLTGGQRWFTTAKALVDTILLRFPDSEGGFYDTADDAPRLVRRPADPSDGVTPSGASAAAGVLLTLGSLTGDATYLRAADAGLAALLPIARRAPRFAGWTLSAVTARLAGPIQVAVVLPDPGPAVGPAAGADLQRTALLSTSPGLVVAVSPEGASSVPLLVGRPAVGGLPTAYPCRGFVCDLPLTDAGALRAALAPGAAGHGLSEG